jgi:hypothetical protein
MDVVSGLLDGVQRLPAGGQSATAWSTIREEFTDVLIIIAAARGGMLTAGIHAGILTEIPDPQGRRGSHIGTRTGLCRTAKLG